MQRITEDQGEQGSHSHGMSASTAEPMRRTAMLSAIANMATRNAATIARLCNHPLEVKWAVMPSVLLILSTLVFIGFGLATFADVAENHGGLAVTLFLAVATLGVALAFARPS